jgi:hypothetical protein
MTSISETKTPPPEKSEGGPSTPRPLTKEEKLLELQLNRQLERRQELERQLEKERELERELERMLEKKKHKNTELSMSYVTFDFKDEDGGKMKESEHD